ncbi:YybH family protein [Devosia sp.]|uniref:YybH family protein n=1 Tax=Devosia sp. TaxID=1871048 RepID=UPI003A93433F
MTAQQTDVQTTHAITDVFEALRQGLLARDAVAICALYLPDALIFDLAPPLGKPIDEAELALWLSSWAGPVERQTRELRIAVSGDLAVANGFVHISAPTHEGELAAWWMRTTTLLQRRDGRWLIAHEHESVPFAMDGSDRALMNLEPEAV